jgi:4-alpha-glucanotransferase
LSASPAEVVLVNLEDLWLEPRPQNVPGTYRERPNWRRKARFSVEEITGDPKLAAALRELSGIRNQSARAK